MQTTEITLSYKNEVLAKFDGVQVYGSWAEMDAVPIEKLSIWALRDQLEYHLNWQKLMPVWYKFRDLKFEDSFNDVNHRYLMRTIENAILNQCKDSPEPAFNELYKGIEWYNSIKS